MTDMQEPDLALRVAGTLSAERYDFDDRTIARVVHLLQHFTGSAGWQPSFGKAQLDALDDALNAVNAAWWEVVRNPHAFGAIAGHYCEEASDRDECLERLRAALDLEPVRFAVRLARRQPSYDAGDIQQPPYGAGEQSIEPRRLVQRLYEMIRGLPGPMKTDAERRDIVRELIGIVDIDLDAASVKEITSAGN